MITICAAGEVPAGSFIYNKKEYPVWSGFEGHYHTGDPGLSKWNRYAKLGQIADKIVAKFKAMIQNQPMSKEAHMAYACLLMLQSGIRVGNEDSAEGYESRLPDTLGQTVQTYGVTTLKPEHVSIQDNALVLHFLGKKQVEQSIKIEDPFLVSFGEDYLDAAVDAQPTWLGIDLGDLTRFIKLNFGEQFVPKDLRTFKANVTAFDLMRPYLDEKPVEKKDAKDEVKMLVAGVAEALGNTPAVAKSAYLDERMLTWFANKRTMPS